MADKADLKFYLTDSEPNLLNVLPSQSIGGYPSKTPYSISALLNEPLDSVMDSMFIVGDLNNPYAVVVDEEIMKVTSITDLDDDYGSENLLFVNRGAFNTNKRFHSAGDTIFVANKTQLFNGSLGSSGKQYRCVVVKNESATATFNSLRFYVKNPSRNTNSKVRIAVEIPSDDVLFGTATGGTTISISDASLINAYDDNFFKDRMLVIDDPASLNVGETRIVASFDKRTGTVTFKSSLPFSTTVGTDFRIEQTPSQRLTSGRVSPLNLTFGTALGINNAVGNVDLQPFQTIYLWFERDVSTNTDKYQDNRVIFTAVYTN